MSLQLSSCAVIAAMCSLAGIAQAGYNVYPVSQARTSTTVMPAGDRCLDNLGFNGSNTLMSGADLMRFSSGTMTDRTGSFNWDDGIERGTSTPRKLWAATPDRADTSTGLAGEPVSSGSISEVFGSPLGFKNLSWLIDGAKKKAYTLDLMLSRENFFTPDNDPTTVEFAVLERGGDSDIAIYGITGYDDSGSPLLTSPIVISRKQTSPAGWMLDSRGIKKAQRVEGAGVSLPQEWGTVIGVRLENQKKFNGADIVGVAMIPSPGAASLMSLAGLVGLRRRRTA